MKRQPTSVISLAVILLGGIQGVGWGGLAPSAAHPARAGDFADFVIAQDLVVIGTVVDARDLDRQVAGASPVGVRCQDITVAVDSVRYGVFHGSTLTISIVFPRRFGRAPPVSGDRVLAWGNRVSEDNWRVWGDACLINAAGELVGPDGEQGAYTTTDLPAGARLTIAHLDSVTTSRQAVHALTAYEGKAALALGRRVAVSRAGPTITLECEGLGWVMGSAATYPRLVDFPALPGCIPKILRGDSLLIPVPPGYSGGRILLGECPSALRVKNGYAPGLGVALASLASALDSTGGRIHVRRNVVGTDRPR